MPQETLHHDRRAEAGPAFSLIVRPAREEVRIQALGELDLASAPILDEQVRELRGAGFTQMAIDLRRVTFIDLAGVTLWSSSPGTPATTAGSCHCCTLTFRCASCSACRGA